MTADPTRPYTVLVVDDSAFMRRLIAEMIDTIAGFRVIGSARDGVDAMAQVHRLQPDIVTLDIEMPGLNGLAVLQRIMAESPRAVVVLSAGGAQYGDVTLRALELGAIDFVRKPSGSVSLDLPIIRDRLVAALEAAARARLTAPPPLARSTPPNIPATSVFKHRAEYVVVMASSTGGPRALAEIIPRLPATLGAAVVVAQHLPGEFTPALADRLSRTSAIEVCEGDDGMQLSAGTVYVARGGLNTCIVAADGASVLRQVSPEAHVGATPSADVLFESASRIFGGACTGVVLTGMGRDGSVGLRQIRAVGGHAIVQDEASSVIYGMPRAAFEECGADRVVALSMMADAILAQIPHERIAWLTA